MLFIFQFFFLLQKVQAVCLYQLVLYFSNYIFFKNNNLVASFNHCIPIQDVTKDEWKHGLCLIVPEAFKASTHLTFL